MAGNNFKFELNYKINKEAIINDMMELNRNSKAVKSVSILIALDNKSN